MKKKYLRYLLFLVINGVVLVDIIQLSESVQLKYISSFIAILSTSLTLILTQCLYQLLLKICGLLSKDNKQFLLNVLYLYLSLNFFVHVSLQKNLFLEILNPILLLFLAGGFFYFRKNFFQKKQIFLFMFLFYAINVMGNIGGIVIG